MPSAHAAVYLDASGCGAGPALELGASAGQPAVTAADCRVVFGADGSTADLRLYQSDGTGAAMPPLPDHADGVTDWDQGAGMFGACLRARSSDVAEVWTLSGGSCAPNDAAPWNAVPATATPAALVASTASSGVVGGWIDLRFGARADVTTPPGAYGAGLVIEVVAAGGAAPTNVTPPAITGTTTDGQTLTVDDGTWTDSPTGYAYQWRRCDAAGTGCVDIGGATASTYVLTSADVGSTMRAVVTATNASGSTDATSAATARVAGVAPANSALPAISGGASVGGTLTTTDGTWTGTTTITHAYQWRRCDAAGASCVDIGGATASSYSPVLADVGLTVRVVVTATNSCWSGCGSTPATSAFVGPVTAAAAPTYIAGYEAGTLGVHPAGCTLYGCTTGTPTVSSTAERSGTYGLVIDPSSSAEYAWNYATGTDVVSRVAVRLTALPATTATLLSVTSTTSSFALRFDPADGRIHAQIDGGSDTVGPVMQAATWTTLELRASVATNTATLDWRVDGAAQATVTAASTAGTLVTVQLGTTLTTETYVAWYDDLAISSTGSDYPLGDGIVTSTSPNVMGINVGAGDFRDHLGGAITATSWTRVDDFTLSIATDSLRQVTGNTGSWLEMGLADTTQTVEPEAARLLVSYRSSTNVANVARVSIHEADGTELARAIDGSMASTTLKHRDAVLAEPAGGWSTAALDGLLVRFGLWDGVGGVPWLEGAMVEVGYPLVAPANLTPPAVVAASGTNQYRWTTVDNGTWSGTAPITYTYQWQLCDSAGANCADIPGATPSSRNLRPGDVGGTVRVRVTATNAAGSASAYSAVSGVVVPPDCTGGPVVDPLDPPTLTPTSVTPGAWVFGYGGTWACSPSFTYEIFDPITLSVFASAIDYKTKAPDDGKAARLRVTATTAQGTTIVTSNLAYIGTCVAPYC